MTDWVLVIQTKIEAIKQEQEASAESMLRTQFKMELLVYTQDSTYSNNLRKRKRKEIEEEEGEIVSSKLVKSNIFQFWSPLSGHGSSSSTKSTEATLKEMMLHLKSYYHVSVHLHPLPRQNEIEIYEISAISASSYPIGQPYKSQNISSEA